MTPLEKQTALFVQALEQAYFVTRDLAFFLGALEEEAALIGPGARELCRGKARIRALLEREAGVCNPFVILGREASYRELAEGICLADGAIRVRERGENAALEPVDLRFSMVCRSTPDGIRLCRLHISASGAAADAGAGHPLPLPNNEAERLRRLLSVKTAELEEKNRDLNVLMSNLPGGVICCENSGDLRLLQYSEGFLEMFGYTARELHERLDDCFYRLVYPEDLAPTWAQIHAQLARGDTKQVEYRAVRADGGVIWVLDHGQIAMTDTGEVFFCVLIDITEKKRAQEALRLSLERHRIIMDQTTDIIFEWDFARDRMAFSNNWMKKFGCALEHLRISPRRFGEAFISPEDLPAFHGMMEDLRRGAPYREAEFRILRGDGRPLWCRARASLQLDGDGRPAKAVGVLIDIDREKRRTLQLVARAERDALTGLYNKATARDLAERYLAQATAERPCALLIIDVDNFKQVNDAYGHLSGDALLADISEALKSMFRAGDVIGRIGGDEFAVVMRDLGGLGIVERKARGILDAFGAMLTKGNYRLSCSIGIAVSPRDGCDFDVIFSKADTALYHAKMEGKNNYAFFAPGIYGFGSGLDAPRPEPAGVRPDSAGEPEALESRLAEYVLRVLYQTSDIEDAIPLIIEIVGRQFDVSRVYIFEDSEDGRTSSNTFEWCNEGVAPQREHLQALSYDALDNYYDNFSESGGIFYCRDTTRLPPAQARIMAGRQVKSTLQCAIRDNGRYRGFVGFDECRENRFWTQGQIAVLTVIAEIVSVFLLKSRAQERIERSLRSIETILDHLDDWLYVIDSETCEVLYANRKSQALMPSLKTGDLCHRAFFGARARCADCPGLGLVPGQSREALLRSDLLGLEILSRATAIPWADGRRATMLCCKARGGAEGRGGNGKKS